MGNASNFRFVSVIHTLWGTVTTSVWAFFGKGKDKGKFLTASLANSYLGTMPSTVAFHINKNFIIPNKVSFSASAITPMTGGHEI